jgi:hypothetical protein
MDKTISHLYVDIGIGKIVKRWYLNETNQYRADQDLGFLRQDWFREISLMHHLMNGIEIF